MNSQLSRHRRPEDASASEPAIGAFDFIIVIPAQELAQWRRMYCEKERWGSPNG